MSWHAQLQSWWQSPPARPVWSLHWAGVGGIILYAATAAASAFPRSGWMKTASEPARWFLVFGLLACFALGYRAVRALPQGGRTVRLIVGYAIGLVSSAVFVGQFHSTDLFTYINRGWQQAEYGVNPYVVPVCDMPTGLTDPMFYHQWLFNTCPYGFVFALESRAISEVAGRDYLLTVALQKSIAVVVFALHGAVVWVGMRVFAVRDRVAGLYLYAWNPLLLLHHVGHAHNDLQMALGVALAVLAAVTGRWVLAFPALAFGVLIKALAVVVVPFLGLYMLRRYGWAKTGVSLAIAGVLVLVVAIPYRDGLLAGRSPSKGTDLTTSLHNSLPAMAFYPIEIAERFVPGLKRNKSETRIATRTAAWVVFFLFYAVVLWRRWKKPGDDRDLVRDAVVVLMGLMLINPKFHSWYVGWVLPVALWLQPDDRLRRAVLALGVMNQLTITSLYKAHFVNVLVMTVLPLWWAFRRPGVEPPVVLAQPSRRMAA